MSFEDVMASVSRWQTALEALAALGAELSLRQSGAEAPPEIAAALRAVTDAAGVGDLDELNPQQQMMAAAIIRLAVSHAVELLAEPGRAAGWTYTDPVILDGWGRGSMMVPPLIAAAQPEFADFTSVLDVGTGVGLLAVAAAGVWPNAKIVGIDVWEPSLERARANVAQAGLDERITIRKSERGRRRRDRRVRLRVGPDVLPRARPRLVDALPALFRATRPGGWIVLGRVHAAARSARGSHRDADEQSAAAASTSIPSA